MPDSIIKNYINGDWVAAATTATGDIYNPATGAKIATVPYSGRSDVDRAVAAARDAYPEWRIPATVRTVIPTADRQKATISSRSQ